jgi:hypothetical protein
MSRRRKIEYDCLAKLESDEPCFVLIGRDREAPAVIKIWATLWLQEISLGLRPEADRPQVTQALKIARDMEIWERDRRQKSEHDALKFDDRGHPTTGPHRHMERNATSGANDAKDG